MLVCSLSKLEVKYLLVLINNIDSFYGQYLFQLICVSVITVFLLLSTSVIIFY